ncbi:MAG: hypothetical protein ACRDJW_10755 [Thermomicrobiales bacterium]
MIAASPKAMAARLAALVEVLLPGDELFPPASTVGVQAVLADRLRTCLGSDAVARVVARLETETEAIVDLPPARRVEAVSRLEREDPDLFAFVLTATYYAYYAAPPVIEALRALGHDYNDTPQPHGYAMTPFDPAPWTGTPAAARGFFKPTTSVARVDRSGLSDFTLPVEEV